MVEVVRLYGPYVAQGAAATGTELQETSVVRTWRKWAAAALPR